MKILSWMIIGLAGIAGVSQAQERTAGSAAASQMSWSALSAQISTVSTKTDAVNTRVDQAVICGRKNMIYAPGAGGTDAQGCVIARPDPNLVNTVNTVNSNLSNLTSNVNSINACAANGGVYNKATNSCASSGARWYFVGAGRSVGNEGYHASRTAQAEGYPQACHGSAGVVGRLCQSPSDRCHKVQFQQNCNETNDSRWCGQSTWPEYYACE